MEKLREKNKFQKKAKQHTCNVHIERDDVSSWRLAGVNSSVRRVSRRDHDPPHVSVCLDVQVVGGLQLQTVFEPGDLGEGVRDLAVEHDGVAGLHPLLAVRVRQRAECHHRGCKDTRGRLIITQKKVDKSCTDALTHA